MPKPLIAVWLDAGDAGLIRQWMAEGHLPHLDAIRREGLDAPLRSFDHSLAETVQQFVLTGQPPDRTGFWSQMGFNPAHYRIEFSPLYDFSEYPPFYALGPGRRVCALDCPQMQFHGAVDGIQLRGWGSHGPMCDFASVPPQTAADILANEGMHPNNGNDYAVLQKSETLESILQAGLRGVDLRRSVLRRLWHQGPWDLFFAVFSEIHVVGHYLIEHPSNQPYFQQPGSSHSLREVYARTDAALGELRSLLPPDGHIAVFSVEGMKQNSDELASIALLPELLFRFSFPGSHAMDFENAPPSPESLQGQFDWVMETWNLRRRPPAWTRLLDRWLPPDWAARAALRLGAGGTLRHPAQFDVMNYQPTLWYSSYWRWMKAFVLPSFSDGFIRINLRGREAHGIVDPDDYDRTCGEIEELLHALQDPASGRPVVQRVIRARGTAASGAKPHPADLVVLWDRPDPCGHVHSPCGTLGPFPGIRAGMHVPDGFLFAAGPRIPAGLRLPERPVTQLHATLFDLMETTPPSPLPGPSLLPAPAQAAAA